MPRPALKSTANVQIVRELFDWMDLMGWSQAEVAARMNTDHPQLSLWRHGYRVPSVAAVQEIADVMGVDLVLRGRVPIAGWHSRSRRA